MAICMAFDTVFEQCSVAIIDGTKPIYQKNIAGGRGQTEIILPMIDEALQASNLRLAQMDFLAFNRGPGAFSGIRINTAVVQALSVASDLPCVGISSLSALAYAAQKKGNYADGTSLLAVMDARQNQLYVGRFIIKQGQPMPVLDESNVHGNEYVLEYGTSVVSSWYRSLHISCIATISDSSCGVLVRDL